MERRPCIPEQGPAFAGQRWEECGRVTEQMEKGVHAKRQGLAEEQGREGVHRRVGARNLEQKRLLWVSGF